MNDLLQFVLDYMRVDAGEAPVVQALMAGAGLYLSNAGIPSPEAGADDALYRLALAALVLHWYDHRDAVGTEAGIPTNLRPILNQLKMQGGAVV